MRNQKATCQQGQIFHIYVFIRDIFNVHTVSINNNNIKESNILCLFQFNVNKNAVSIATQSAVKRRLYSIQEIYTLAPSDIKTSN